MSDKITENCARSLSLLSDYRDGALNEEEKALVREHLAECPPCLVVHQDIDLIIMSAPVIRGEDGIAYPDENVIWQRMRLTKTTIH
jgi:predicted anti-sigma-YlaC factor YlaD